MKWGKGHFSLRGTRRVKANHDLILWQEAQNTTTWPKCDNVCHCDIDGLDALLAEKIQPCLHEYLYFSMVKAQEIVFGSLFYISALCCFLGAELVGCFEHRGHICGNAVVVCGCGEVTDSSYIYAEAKKRKRQHNNYIHIHRQSEKVHSFALCVRLVNCSMKCVE